MAVAPVAKAHPHCSQSRNRCYAVISCQASGADAAAFVGGKKWYKSFMKRHPDVKEMNSSLMEEERTHAVGRESVGRYFSLAEVALEGVTPPNTWFADEAYLEFHSKRGWAVSRPTARAR